MYQLLHRYQHLNDDICSQRCSLPASLIIMFFQVLCTLIAAFLHFFFLSSFCWVLTEAWQSYMAVTGRLRNRIIRKRFLCLGWGGPSVCCPSSRSIWSFSLLPFLMSILFSSQVSLHQQWRSQWDLPRQRDMEHQASKHATLQFHHCIHSYLFKNLCRDITHGWGFMSAA